MISSVKSEEHAPLWQSLEKDILPEEIQLCLEHHTRPIRICETTRTDIQLTSLSTRVTLNRKTARIWKKYEGAAQE